jgi:elongation factor Tu
VESSHPNDEVEIVIKESPQNHRAAIEMFRKTLEDARAGEMSGFCCVEPSAKTSGSSRSCCRPGSVTFREFEANAYIPLQD